MCPAAGEYGGKCLDQNSKISSQRPVAHVFELYVSAKRVTHVAASVRLPRPSHPRLERQKHGGPVSIHVDLFLHDRSRTHEGHLALQHVDELRQLIEARLTQEPPNPRKSWIAI